MPPLDESAFRKTRKSTVSKSTLSATNRRAGSQALFLAPKVGGAGGPGERGGGSDGEEGMGLTSMTGMSNPNAVSKVENESALREKYKSATAQDIIQSQKMEAVKPVVRPDKVKDFLA